ncbi:hypothetical protein UFOVP1028_19 [uncultured Caudovirales phage]|uniref:Uncharacterized protein n=1 Tax=uncultured Caudovirales phage TaxID=2100421 RepID=A0A6J5Q468_9CAUD|nr:hypothetical protein UFOVP960_30 [uncultured Caudovirales phage]CAB4178933.1 hypothetical protein UFOVP1028_19 [uncultured Caudovirales phage]CAB4189463.1 hypothetical protein UFOVP1187_46 [uncultured Caudovirales phage]CAB4192208.1 hypothetical protein UFOVP1235_17 [uncultured Caudovirales phage]CAB4215985.1 hypothetical protein UFOVP1488_46 [uncultured Caudovirales phage]
MTAQSNRRPTARGALRSAECPLSCTCPPVWHGIIPPYCQVHNPQPTLNPWAVTTGTSTADYPIAAGFGNLAAITAERDTLVTLADRWEREAAEIDGLRLASPSQNTGSAAARQIALSQMARELRAALAGTTPDQERGA